MAKAFTSIHKEQWNLYIKNISPHNIFWHNLPRNHFADLILTDPTKSTICNLITMDQPNLKFYKIYFCTIYNIENKTSILILIVCIFIKTILIFISFQLPNICTPFLQEKVISSHRFFPVTIILVPYIFGVVPKSWDWIEKDSVL